MLETAGLNEKDRGRVLEMIMEVSGARETVDKAMKARFNVFFSYIYGINTGAFLMSYMSSVQC